MLTQEQTLEFKTRLRQRAGDLREEIRQTLARSSEESHVRIAEQVRDLEDESLSNLIVDINLAEIDRDMAELRRIDSALVRLNDTTYGTCTVCGQQIPLGRLEAEPTAERCIRCQELYEKTHAAVATPSL